MIGLEVPQAVRVLLHRDKAMICLSRHFLLAGLLPIASVLIFYPSLWSSAVSGLGLRVGWGSLGSRVALALQLRGGKGPREEKRGSEKVGSFHPSIS